MRTLVRFSFLMKDLRYTGCLVNCDKEMIILLSKYGKIIIYPKSCFSKKSNFKIFQVSFDLFFTKYKEIIEKRVILSAKINGKYKTKFFHLMTRYRGN